MAGKFCRKVDYSVKYAQSLIDDFSVKGKDPYIVASVDMLDTGIDVPEVVNLMFFKLVRSKTKFWQMIGRGRRLCEDLFEPGKDKKEFIVFDYCQNLEFFDANPDGYDSGIQDECIPARYTASYAFPPRTVGTRKGTAYGTHRLSMDSHGGPWEPENWKSATHDESLKGVKAK